MSKSDSNIALRVFAVRLSRGLDAGGIVDCVISAATTTTLGWRSQEKNLTISI